MEISYSKSAAKAINGLDRPTKQRIRDGILGLTKKPPEGDIRPLQGYNDGRQRLRVGKYRVIFKFDLESEIQILYIMNVGSRGDIYK
nr:MAG TPA: Cytotoxic translational repressor [Caudoviricetes sp.]